MVHMIADMDMSRENVMTLIQRKDNIEREISQLKEVLDSVRY